MRTEVNFSVITSLTPYGEIVVFVDPDKRRAYVVPRWVSRDLKVSWQGLRQKLGDPNNPLKDCLEMKKIPTPPHGRKHFAILLPLEKLSEWAASIDPSQFSVGPGLKKKIAWLRDKAYGELMPYVERVLGETGEEAVPEVIETGDGPSPEAAESPEAPLSKQDLYKIKFYGRTLSVVKDEEGAWVSLPDICKATQLDPSRQSRKLEGKRWAKTKYVTVKDDSGVAHEFEVIHEETIPQWLATVDETCVPHKAYSVILLYQEKLQGVIHDVFAKDTSTSKVSKRNHGEGNGDHDGVSAMFRQSLTEDQIRSVIEAATDSEDILMGGWIFSPENWVMISVMDWLAENEPQRAFLRGEVSHFSSKLRAWCTKHALPIKTDPGKPHQYPAWVIAKKYRDYMAAAIRRTNELARNL